MKKSIFTLVLSFLVLGLYAQDFIMNHTGDYLGQIPPKDSAIIFAPEIVSVSGRYEYGLAISPNHDEIFFTAESPENNKELSGLIQLKRVGENWTKPQLANLNQSDLWEQEAFFGPNGNMIYYAISDSVNTKIWFSTKTSDGWSKGKLLNSPINNSSKRIFYATFSENGNLYYTNVDEFKIYMAEYKNGSYNSFIDIGLPRAGHAFIAPDESFIVFDSRPEDSYGKLDIYIAFKTNNGDWNEPINLGPKVNTGYSETCPSLSPDGKYIFFGRYNDKDGKSNIYWISSEIIENIKP